jgi:UDP-3-O-[3-hydroxymyristoyl] glucosamine N-acyltransferase
MELRLPGHTLAAIAAAVDGELRGDPGLVITRVGEVEEAGEGDICVVIDRRYASGLRDLHASALILPRDLDLSGRPVILVANPRRALILLLGLFYPETRKSGGIQPGALVSPNAELGQDVFVGAGATIEAGAVIGNRCQIFGNTFVGERAILGDECVLFPNVTLYPGVMVGRRVRIHSGAVIGSDGFGYDRDMAGVQHKIPQVGTVEIGDDVEIGANCAIDRATMGATRIGEGSKIDNLVQIGHNCQIGKHCCIIGLVGLSGSVTIGDYCVLAGQAGIADHVTLADHVVVGAQAGVHRDLPPGNWLGSPAIPAEEAYRVYTTLSRLPEIRKVLRSLEDRCRRLEEELAHLRKSSEGRT